jgi:hypothetical protein
VDVGVDSRRADAGTGAEQARGVGEREGDGAGLGFSRAIGVCERAGRDAALRCDAVRCDGLKQVLRCDAMRCCAQEVAAVPPRGLSSSGMMRSPYR